MKFLAMLLAVLVHWRDRPPPLAWPARWIPVATAAPEWSRLLTTVAVPAAVAGLLLWLLGGWLWGLLGFLIQLLVLVGCSRVRTPHGASRRRRPRGRCAAACSRGRRRGPRRRPRRAARK